jgi:hypothetical protein
LDVSGLAPPGSCRRDRGIGRARRLIASHQYVLRSGWGPSSRAPEENAFLESRSWEEYAEWHLGLTEGAAEETKARYAFVHGDSAESTAPG